MRRILPRFCGRFLVVSCVAAAALSTASGGGANPSSPTAQLRSSADSLTARSHRALLDLYAAETQLTTARGRLAALQRELADLRGQRALVRREVTIAARVRSAAQKQLAEHLKTLYEQGQPDPLAVILSAASLDEALSSIDALDRMAAQDRRIVAQTATARRTLSRLSVLLAARTARLTAAEQQAASSVAALEQARLQRTALVSSLRSQERFTRGRIASLEATALAAQAKTQQLTAAASAGSAPATDAPAPTSGAAAPAPAGGRTLTVSSTGYSLPGRTATGLPVGWGVVAVDPSVIPLGTHMTVPGYGEAVAADTGGAVRGATIDLWFPTVAQARAWGRRTVTITLH